MKNKLFFISIFALTMGFFLTSEIHAQEKTFIKTQARTQVNQEIMEVGDEMTQERKEYLEKLRVQREERNEEKIEIRNMNQDGKDVNKETKGKTEIESRSIKAKLNGAQFNLDPITNQVLLTTPSGQEHILKHLPDQAITRMEENGFFNTGDEEIEVETTADGIIQYKMDSSQPKKFLGIIKREVPVDVTLNDETGEVTTTEIQPKSFWGKFLNRFSF
jgi:hypothetical protein